MPKAAKSQWDFGELFAPEQTRKVFSVSELTTQVKRTLEKQFGQVWVSGEISNLRLQNSGHMYFTLKDAGAQLACVLFRGEAGARRDYLLDGQKVLLQGDLTVYEPRGQHQLVVRTVELQGVGALQAAFERLKQKLEAEGLFAPDRKRPLPRYVQRIGLITSPTGAAIRDVLTVVQRRNPSLQVVLSPCKVQGEGAAREIAAALHSLNSFNDQCEPDRKLDLVLMTRGGGSLEDLWAFNEEIVARAICESDLPVVSAIGHEIDFTISDFVADLRAPTPSAAAEIITEGMFSCRQYLEEITGWMQQRTASQVRRIQESLRQVHQRLLRCHPRRRVDEHLQYLDDLSESLARNVQRRLREVHLQWHNLESRLSRTRPGMSLTLRKEQLAELVRRMLEQIHHTMDRRQSVIAGLIARLRLLSPEQTLARGYSITTDALTGRIIRTQEEVSPGKIVKTRVHKGQFSSVVQKTEG